MDRGHNLLPPQKTDSIQPPLKEDLTPSAQEKQKSFVGKLWERLKKPEAVSREGLTALTELVAPSRQAIESGQVSPLGIAARTAGETLAEVAPSFISRSAVLGSAGASVLGAAAPILAPVGKVIAQGAEGISGLTYKTPKVLEAAFKDPSLIFSKGKQVAQPLYEAAKSEIPAGISIFKGLYKPEEIIDVANEVISKGGKLEPAEALVARKSVDVLMKSGRYIKDELKAMRDTFNEMAKVSETVKKADITHARGTQAGALRTLYPLNKTGTPSKFQIGTGVLGSIVAALTGHPYIAASSLASVPAVQGVTATGLGLASRLASNQELSTLLGSILSKNKESKKPLSEELSR